MFDRYDARDDDRDDRDRGRDLDRGGRGGGHSSERRERDPRDVFTRELDLPRGRDRERVRDRDRVYDIDGSEARMLATVGSFRVVAESDLSELRDDARKPRQSIRHLEGEGLIRRSPLDSNDRVVVLTERGRDLLEANRSIWPEERTHEPRQVFYAGLRKPRGLSHDVKVYRAYERAEARIRDRGGRVHRVVLDYEMKRDYSASCMSAIAARRTVTAGLIEKPMRSSAGRRSASCPTKSTDTSTFRMPASSTRIVMAVRASRTSRS